MWKKSACSLIFVMYGMGRVRGRACGSLLKLVTGGAYAAAALLLSPSYRKPFPVFPAVIAVLVSPALTIWCLFSSLTPSFSFQFLLGWLAVALHTQLCLLWCSKPSQRNHGCAHWCSAAGTPNAAVQGVRTFYTADVTESNLCLQKGCHCPHPINISAWKYF